MGRPKRQEESPASDVPSDPPSDRQKAILSAAAEVFAEKGFHKTRVSDIAQRAGVAYGLIYHYFGSKERLLITIFDQNWRVFLRVLDQLIEDPSMDAPARLRAVVHLLVDALQVVPSSIRVIIQEVSRSDRFAEPEKLEAFRAALTRIERIIQDGQKNGSLRPHFDPRVASYLFLGALETVCTGFMLGAIPCQTPEEAERVKSSFREILEGGMASMRSEST